jgi:6-phosphogluconolactonase
MDRDGAEPSTHRDVVVSSDVVALMEAVAARIVWLCERAITARGRFTWALSGGSTPRQLYALLATPRFVSRIDWTRVEFFWGDERCVPPDHPDSNYRMVREALFDEIHPDAARVHRMLGEQEPARAAAAYEAVLRCAFAVPDGGPAPRFDLVLLGMGGDGHTASLFPGTAAVAELSRWVVVNRLSADSPTRLTLTRVVIDQAAEVIFLVSGASKAERLKQVLEGSNAGSSLPAQLIRPTHGRLQWFVDADAASQLETRR